MTSSNHIISIIESHLESQSRKDAVLDNLTTVQISGLVGLRAELLFSKILLASSPSLEDMFLSFRTDVSYPNEILRIKQEFSKLPRKSQKAELLWCN